MAKLAERQKAEKDGWLKMLVEKEAREKQELIERKRRRLEEEERMRWQEQEEIRVREEAELARAAQEEAIRKKDDEEELVRHATKENAPQNELEEQERQLALQVAVRYMPAPLTTSQIVRKCKMKRIEEYIFRLFMSRNKDCENNAMLLAERMRNEPLDTVKGLLTQEAKNAPRLGANRARAWT